MKSTTLWLISGIISVIGGIFALLNPVQATLAAELIAGWVLLFAGCVQIFGGFKAEGTSSKVWIILGGVAAVILGFMLLANPLAGVISLTLVAGIMFLFSGIMKIIVSFSLKGTGLFWVVLLSGVLSLLLALMVLGNFPESAVTLLGILLGVELISNGAALISFSMMEKEMNKAA